jgi:hypothetical protein
MIGGDRMRDVLHQHRLTGTRLCINQRALSLPIGATRSRRAARYPCWSDWQFHLQPLGRIERCQIIEMDLVPDFFRIVEIDGVDLSRAK